MKICCRFYSSPPLRGRGKGEGAYPRENDLKSLLKHLPRGATPSPYPLPHMRGGEEYKGEKMPYAIRLPHKGEGNRSGHS
jgi:hypothetical protein